MESGLRHEKSWKVKPNGCRILDPSKCFWLLHTLLHTSLWREMQKLEPADRRVCHKPAVWQKKIIVNKWSSSILSDLIRSVQCNYELSIRAEVSFFLPRAKDGLLSSPSLSVLPLSLPAPLEVWPLKPSWGRRGLEERCKLPSAVWGEAPADKRFGAYWSQRVQLWWQQFLLTFVAEIQFLIDPIPPMRSYSSGALATIAPCPSVPMELRDLPDTLLQDQLR